MDIETYLHLIAQIEKGLAEITEKEASLSATEALLCYLLDLELAKAEYELEKEKDKQNTAPAANGLAARS